MKDAKPAKTPLGADGHLDLNKGGKFVNQKAYRSMIGSLLFFVLVDRTLCLVYACVLDFNPTPRSVTLWPLNEFLGI
jgi:hypothetical protein